MKKMLKTVTKFDWSKSHKKLSAQSVCCFFLRIIFWNEITKNLFGEIPISNIGAIKSIPNIEAIIC